MTSPPSAIAAFVPRLILHGLAGEGAPAQVPAELETTGFALFADLTGFTRYTEELVRQQGRSLGAEQLAHALNASMGRLVGAVAEHQGDVVAFAGDALLAIWPTPPGQDRRLLRPARGGQRSGHSGAHCIKRGGRQRLDLCAKAQFVASAALILCRRTERW
jgi:class 3 adenylate cyclase